MLPTIFLGIYSLLGYFGIDIIIDTWDILSTKEVDITNRENDRKY